MKKIIFAAAACMAAQFAFGIAASQEWVASKLASVGMRIDTSTVTTNVVSGATNIVITSSFSCEDLPGIRQIRLTISPPELSHGDGAVDHDKPYVSCTILDGSISDGRSWFSFADGWTLEQNIILPEPMPTGVHSCNIGPGCNCTMKDNTRESVLAALPDDYKDLTAEEGLAMWPSPLPMIDKDSWGDEPWQKKVTVGQNVSYFVTDSPADGASPHTFNVQAIGASSAWLTCVAKMMDKWNQYLAEMRDLYVDERICTAENPQHDTVVKSCGIYAWATCRRNCGYSSGTEQHQYPGSSIDDTYHACVCGHGDPEKHGTLVPSGSKTLTYNTSGKETGWTQTYVCPKACGHSKSVTHVHHFVNCGTCDAGDGCDTVCTGCNGEHVWGEATVTGIAENDLCAKCECTMCEGCNANPPATNMTLHAGWMPCGVDPEIDNDDGTAKGAHCQCQCLTFGHNAAIHGINESEHDYQRSAGMAEYEQIKDHTAPTRAATYHYEILGQCTRCKQYKKQLEAHEWPSDPTEYRYVSDSVCAYLYECEKCQEKKRDETHGHELGSSIVYVNVSASICRQRKQCEHCKAFIDDDTSGHTRDSANGCKCANGCGYQFDHNYVADACGNSVCSYCGSYQYSQESHAGYKSGGTKSAAGHQCACGVKPDVPHTFGSPVVLTRDGWNVTYRKTCTACGYYYDETKNENPCQSGHVLNTQSDTCECMCGYYSPSNNVSTAQEMHNFADTENEDGVQTCTCKCGRFHVQRQWTTYRKNTEDAVGSKGACLNICAYCTDKEGTGLDIGPVDDSRHTPRTKGTCGCKCGKLTADGTNLEQFHIQKPGSCRCYGSDGNGGGWHFKCPKDGCTKICAYSSTSGLYSGADHHVASSAKEKAMPAKATPSDHTKTDAAACGCKCGTYTSANYSSWTQHANLHNSYPYHCGCYCGHASESQISPYHKKASDSQCKCQCGAKVVSHVKVSGDCKCQCRAEHYKQERQDGKCPGVCHGPCGEYADYSHKDKHTPKENGCGCECGAFGGSSYTGAGWHHGTGSPSCHCSCGYLHRFVASDCPNVCATCGYDVSGARNDSGIHTFPSGQCECICGRFKSHKFASDACECYCGDLTRGHIWRLKSKTQTDSYSCQQCGKTIREYHIVWECSRCGEEFDGTDIEEGHDPDCGLAGDEGDEYPGGYCEKHNEYYDDECPYCKEEEEGGGDGGGGSGGSTGGTGGYRDI